jgi:leucyl/phenylalanyl-tRNA---protein transferase
MIPPEVLLQAYSQGCFPMADEFGEISWYSADPRPVLPLDAFHIPRRLARTIRTAGFTHTRDRCFRQVMAACSENREMSWISTEMVESYSRLHELGFAHSVETWQEGELVGGLYGVHLGSAFFGESIFNRVGDAGKAALVHVAAHLRERGFQMLEIQMVTPLTAQFKPRMVGKREYTRLLASAIGTECEW